MSPGAPVQVAESEIGILVNEATVFRAYQHSSHEGERIVHPAAVQERAACIGARSHHRASAIVGWSEDQSACSAERIGTQSANCKRKVEGGIDRGLMHIGLNPGVPTGGEVSLRVASPAVVGLQRKPVVKAIAISDQYATALCRSAGEIPSVCIFGEESRSLNTDLIPLFLRNCGNAEKRDESEDGANCSFHYPFLHC